MLTEETTCYRHPQQRAAVGCQRCERPICTDCMTPASIGHHCPECLSQTNQQVYTAQTLPSARPSNLLIGLIAVNVLAFLAQMASPDVVSNGLCGFLVVDDRATSGGMLCGVEVADGEWWRIITSAFLHGSLLHIAFNMYALWVLGPPLLEALGRLRFALIYLAGLLGGSAAVLAFDWGQPTLGASGAVLGLGGGLAAALWARGISITQTSLGAVLGFNLFLPLLVGRISFWGHFGGILAGFIAGWLLTWLPNRFGRSMPEAVAATVGLCVALAVAAVAVAGADGLL